MISRNGINILTVQGRQIKKGKRFRKLIPNKLVLDLRKNSLKRKKSLKREKRKKVFKRKYKVMKKKKKK